MYAVVSFGGLFTASKMSPSLERVDGKMIKEENITFIERVKIDYRIIK